MTYADTELYMNVTGLAAPQKCFEVNAEGMRLTDEVDFCLARFYCAIILLTA